MKYQTEASHQPVLVANEQKGTSSQNSQKHRQKKYSNEGPHLDIETSEITDTHHTPISSVTGTSGAAVATPTNVLEQDVLLHAYLQYRHTFTRKSVHCHRLVFGSSVLKRMPPVHHQPWNRDTVRSRKPKRPFCLPSRVSPQLIQGRGSAFPRR